MNPRLVLLLLISMAQSFVRADDDPRVTAFLQQGFDCDSRHETSDAIAALEAAIQLDPASVPSLILLSKQYSDLVDDEKSDAKRLAARASLDAAQRAVKLAPDNAQCHLSLSIAYGKLTDYVGNKTKVDYSKLIHDEALKAAALNPRDDFAWHVLGRWNYSVTNVNLVLRALCKIAYGGLPVASNEASAQNYLRAIEIAPWRIIHHQELARTYAAMDCTELARKQWQTVLDLPAVDKSDDRAKAEARKALGTTL
jgi:tetratricopeptide (TPR) repeat protein